MPWRPWSDLAALVELAAPSACAGCAGEGGRWCADCAATLRVPVRRWSPTPCPEGLPPTWAGPTYDGPVRAAVVAWKEHDRVDLGGDLAAVLARSLAAAVHGSPEHARAVRAGQPVAVVPAPSARSSTRSRGRSPVQELARAAGGSGAMLPALALGRPVRDQAGLTAAQRAANLAGAVVVRRRWAGPLRGIPCVLVDDVVTTGSTLAECARALRAAGVGPLVAATVAATARRSGGSPDTRLSLRPGAV